MNEKEYFWTHCCVLLLALPRWVYVLCCPNCAVSNNYQTIDKCKCVDTAIITHGHVRIHHTSTLRNEKHLIQTAIALEMFLLILPSL